MNKVRLGSVGVEGRCILVFWYPLLVIGSLIGKSLVRLILQLLVLVDCIGYRYMILRFGVIRIHGIHVAVLGVERERRWIMSKGE